MHSVRMCVWCIVTSLFTTNLHKVRSAEEFIKPCFSRNTDKSSYIALLNFKVLICSMIYNTLGINSYQVCLHWWGISSSY